MKSTGRYWLFCLILAMVSLPISLTIGYLIVNFLHIEIGQKTYVISFTIMIAASLFALKNILVAARKIKTALLGAALGYFCSTISCLVEYSLTQYGTKKAINTLFNFGIPSIPMFMFLFIPPIITGGWLVGAILCSVIPKAQHRAR